MKPIEKGYKLTEIGKIPEDWEVVRLGDVGNFMFKLDKEEYIFTEQGFAIISRVSNNAKTIWVNLIRMFVKLRKICQKIRIIPKKFKKLAQKIEKHSKKIKLIFYVIKYSISPKEKNLRKICFRRE